VVAVAEDAEAINLSFHAKNRVNTQYNISLNPPTKTDPSFFFKLNFVARG
jgi:hypothetical protein